MDLKPSNSHLVRFSQVAQLHIHIVPRFKSDIAWPGPMWGAHPAQPFPSEEFQNCLNKIKLHTM